MLERYGFQSPRSAIAHSPDEAVQIASSIRFPVCLKIVSPDILHKTDVGGVQLNLQSSSEVRRAFQQIIESVCSYVPQARITGIQVQEMVKDGVEIIIGLLDDSQFGPVIMFGLGGILTQVLSDVTFRVLPIDRKDAGQMIREIKGYGILRGFRDKPAVSERLLIDLLMNAAQMGMDQRYRLESADFNPILVWQDQHQVVDAKFVWFPQPRPASAAIPANPAYLESFFKAKSVAVIGASTSPGKIGNAVLESLLKHDYRGRVYPVNPTHKEILGARAFPSLSSIPQPVELAVATVDLRLVPDLITECAAKNTHNLVVISGGGKELGGDKVELEAEIRRRAQACSVRVIGPNCIGVFDAETRLDTFFQTHDRMLRPKRGRIAMLTQSGTVGGAFLEDLAQIGLSKFVSYGNRIDVDEADLLVYLASDPETEVIAMYIEGLEDGRKFLETARQVSKQKPVVVYKVGRNERAARAAVSHTGFFGGSSGVVQGALKQAGLIEVHSYEELVAASKALAMQPKAKGNRVAMISNGAGTMVQGIDLLPGCALQLAELSAASIKKLSDHYPSFYLVQNPIDLTGSASSSDYEMGIDALLQDPAVDIVMAWFVFMNIPLQEDIVAKLGRLSEKHDKPILAGGYGTGYSQRISQAIEAEGIPVFHSVRDWVTAARALVCAGSVSSGGEQDSQESYST